MVMLDDATEDNGFIHMVRCSLKIRPARHISEDGLFSGGCSQTEIWEDRRGIVFQYRADGVWKDTGIMIWAGVLRLPKSRRYPEHPFGHAWH